MFLSCIFYFFIGAPEEYVVNCGCEKTEKDHQYCEHQEALEGVDQRDKILEKIQGLGHGIEHVLEVSGYLNFVLIQTV